MLSLIPWRNRENNGTRELRPYDHPLAAFRDGFNNLFDQFFGRWPELPGWNGPGSGLDLEDAGKEVIVRVDAPGFEAEDFDIQVKGNVLTLRAERKQESDDQQKGRSRTERRLHQSVTLPAGVDPEKVDAHYRNGVLELRLARTPQAQPRRIEVKP